MGNCQAVDAAALVVQHPNGQIDRMYRPVKANEVMKMNPGHYVSLIIPLSVSGNETALTGDQKKTVQYTRVKLLRPTDTLLLGHAYRLLTSQEVKKVLRAKKLAKEKICETGLPEKLQLKEDMEIGIERVKPQKHDEGLKHERRLRTGITGSINSRSKTWQPSLQSISEAVN